MLPEEHNLPNSLAILKCCETPRPMVRLGERGQYPHPRKEHIANREQIVYSAVLALPGRGRFVAGLPIPGHKEHGP
jgi:hypothetical protein